MVVANMTILSEVVNATLILVISEVDSVMLIKWHPSTKWQAFAQDLYRAAVRKNPLSFPLFTLLSSAPLLPSRPSLLFSSPSLPSPV